MRFIAVPVLLSLICAGCAVHPLPEDVTRDTTSAIVKKIQCEAREALDDITIDILNQYGDAEAKSLVPRIAEGSLKVSDMFSPKYPHRFVVAKEGRDLLLAYTLTAVTFDFNFTISETNDNSAGVDFRLPTLNGVFSLGASAEAKLQRQNIRKFQITNSFFELHDMDPSSCVDVTARSGNIVYPITGKIGLEEVFRTFVDLDRGAGSTKQADSVHLFTDTLTFTTTLTASVNPKITLNPSTRELLRLADASGTFSENRVDAHQVAIALARGKRFVSIDDARRSAKIASRVIADQNRVDFFFNGFRPTVTPSGGVSP